MNFFLRESACHACGNTIEKGRWFCKTCGRSRGLTAILQFKKWELLAASGVLLAACCFALLVAVPVTAAAIGMASALGATAMPPTRQPGIAPTDENVAAAPTAKPDATEKPVKATTVPKKQADFQKYSCPDKSRVKLRIGSRAMVSKYDVNLRSAPKVSDPWNANVVTTLRDGDKMTVIAGPRCAHAGTWWRVRTDGGHTGWAREQQDEDKVLLVPID